MPRVEAVETTGAAKRRGRPKANANTDENKPTKSPGRRTSPESVLNAKPAGVNKRTATTKKRQALKEIRNAPEADDIDDLDDFDILSEPYIPTMRQNVSPPKRVGRKAKAASAEPQPLKPRGKRGAATAAVGHDRMEIPETQQEPPVQTKLARTGTASTATQPRPAKREPIPDTQPEPMEVEEPGPPPSEVDRMEDSATRPVSVVQKRARSVTRQPHTSTLQRRGGSTSDVERGNDPSLRRKVGELTKKLEALEMKYNTIRDLSVNDAESAFDKLKKHSDEKSKSANDLIASLRAELKAHSSVAADIASLREQLGELNTANESLSGEKKTLQTSLNEANNEVKSLQAKLAASRSSSTAIQGVDIVNGRLPGSAVKPTAARTLLVGSAEAAKEAQKRVLKEELYSDLTGLILRDVKRREEAGEEVYDCIQTGRNGTLHFHLTLQNARPNPNNGGAGGAPQSTAQAYEDAEFQYRPLLDPNHDRDLIDVLPDYLTEEICFPRSNAAKFYSRVVDCLTKKIEMVTDDEE